MKKIYILTAIFALLTLSLNAQVQASKFGTDAPPKSPTGKVQAPNRADVLISGCSWDVNTDGTTLPTGWQTTNNLSTNPDGSAYINSSGGGTITIPSSLLQGNSTVNVVINAASYNGTSYNLSVNNSSKSVYDQSFSDYTWLNVNATNGITITMNSWNVSLISIKVYANSDPSIVAIPNNVTFKSAPNVIATQTVEVTGSNLTTGITATLNDPNNVFAINTNSLGANGGSLTVTYSPTAIGSHNGTITLTSGSATTSITLNGSCVQELTVCDGSTMTGDLPIYGLWYDATSGQHNQMIYLANELTSLVNNDITSMTFYAPSGLKFSGGSVTFSIGETTTNEFSSATALTDNVTPVATVVPNGETEWLITFSTPYTYNGGNLLIQVDSQTGTWGSTSFTGMDVGSNRGLLSYNSNNSLKSTLPKVTFGFISNTNPKIEVSPETLTISDSGTNNTFTVQGANLGNDNVGVTVPQGSAFSTTTSDQWWGFVNNNGSVSGTVTVTYGGRDLSATETVTAANNLTSATVNVTYVPDLYIVGNFGSDWNYSADATIPMTNDGNGIYTATLNDIPANSYILFSRKIGETYYWDNNRLFIGARMDNGQDWEYGYEQPGWLDTDPSYPSKYRPIHFSEGGSYTITIDANNYTFTIEEVVLPAPENVVATVNSDQISATVTWDAPSNSSAFPLAPTTLIWDFEEQADFADFTTIDNDGDGYNWNWYTNVGASSTLVTHDNSDGVIYSQSYDKPTQTVLYPDNWLISPEINLGGSVSFWACGQDANQYWNEVFAVYVCVGSYSGVSDFIKISPDVTTTHDMTKYTYDLSQYQGTGYFAIRHYNVHDEFYLNVDDITCETFAPAPPVSYNIYLDGQFVANVPSTTDPLSYDFGTLAAGTYTASVSAVYEGGIESAATPSNTFTIVPKTDAPAISVVPGETAYTITATAADPNAAVVLTVDGVEYTGTGSVSVTIDRGTSDKNVAVSATAQEDGKLVSDPAEQTVNVPMLPITPTPTITYEQTNATVVVTATGEGTVYLEVDGQTASGEGTVSITIMRSIDDKTVTANATAVDTNHQPSATASEDITIPALAGNPATAKEGLLRMHLLVVDQFKEEIPDDNSHPDRYGYVLKWEEPANVADHKESGTVKVDIKKTEAQVNGYYTLSQVEADTNHDNSEITLDVLTADVGMYLPGEDPDVLYYEMQSKKDANPALGEDYITQLQYIKNAQKYEEMLATSPNKTHQYPAEETYHYFDDSTPIVTGTYGVNFMTYAPSVSTWGIQRRYFEVDGLDNTYGAPIWKTGVGQVRVISTEAQLQRGPQGSTQWDGVGGPCSLVFLGVEAFGDLPSADVSNIQYEPYMFRVWVQSPGNYLRGCNLIGEHVDPNKPGEHWDGDGTCYGAVPVLVYEQLTTDGHLYKHVQSMEEGNNVEWGEKIQFGALDSGINDLIVYIRFYYRSTGHGISGTRFTLRGNRDGDDETPEVPGYYASEGDGNPDITTGINGVYSDLNKPVESVTYVNAQGMTNDQPFDGVNIVITRYTDGTMTTTKLVR